MANILYVHTPHCIAGWMWLIGGVGVSRFCRRQVDRPHYNSLCRIIIPTTGVTTSVIPHFQFRPLFTHSLHLTEFDLNLGRVGILLKLLCSVQRNRQTDRHTETDTLSFAHSLTLGCEWGSLCRQAKPDRSPFSGHWSLVSGGKILWMAEEEEEVSFMSCVELGMWHPFRFIDHSVFIACVCNAIQFIFRSHGLPSSFSIDDQHWVKDLAYARQRYSVMRPNERKTSLDEINLVVVVIVRAKANINI